MFDHLTEIMLKNYYIAENTVGRFCADKRPLFFAYAKIFLLPQKETERLFALSQTQEVLQIQSEREYHQYLRMKQYLAMNARPTFEDPEIDEIIDLKGTAFTLAINFQLMVNAKDVRAVVCENLTIAAENGLVLALNALGVLQSEGIVFHKDEENGRKKILCAAEWNSEEGLLAALYYDPAHREKYLECLQGCLVRIGHPELFERVQAMYGPYVKGQHGEYRLLEKAFRQGIIKREVYNKSYARLAYSEILGERDKETLLLTPNKELFAEASSLPLKLGHDTAEFHAKALDGVRPDHPEEKNKVICALGNIDLRMMATYRPLCFVSDSKYMLDYYAALLSRCFEMSHMERIEICDLADYDFEPTKNNIFVRSCDEDSFNLYFLTFRGRISDRAFDMAKNFLQSAKRGKYRLNRPSVALDLSSVLPVCFCDRENAKKLKPYCDMISIVELTAKEKQLFTQRAMQEKGSIYGVKKLTIQDGLAEKLSVYGMDEIDRAIDTAVREHRTETLVLTESLMRPYIGNIGTMKQAYGFGGSIHDDHE